MNYSDQLKGLSKQLTKSKFLITKPSKDVFNTIQAFIVLVKGVKTKDWLLAQQLMSVSLEQMIDQILINNIETTNILQCKKLLLQVPQQQTALGKQLNQLIQVSLKHLDTGATKLLRSKSTNLARKSNHENSVVNPTKIGNLVKAYKDDVKKMLDQRQSLKRTFADRTNRHLEILKEQMKKVNKNSYFLSPRKQQHDSQRGQSADRNYRSQRKLY